MKMDRIIVFFLFAILIASCKKDDGGGITITPPRPLTELKAEDEAKLETYLKTHFYNYEEFSSPAADFDYKIKFDTINGDNADKTSLFDHGNLKRIEVDVASNEIGLDDDAVVTHTMYYLEARKGTGNLSPTIADSTFVTFEGQLLDGIIFQPLIQPSWQGTVGFLKGYISGIVNMNAGPAVTTNPDGSFEFDNYGVGAFFMPSALGYYSVAQTNIPQYSPLIFKVDLLTVNDNTDHDNDGIPSYLEDVNNNSSVVDDNTDNDFTLNANRQQVPLFNYLDTDDDGDGTPTREEINLNEDGSFNSFRDTDGDSIYDHLDSDS